MTSASTVNTIVIFSLQGSSRPVNTPPASDPVQTTSPYASSMAPHITDRVEPAVVPASPSLTRTRRLDWRLKLAVLVGVSSSLQLVLRQNASSFLGSELGSITRAEREDWEPLAHLAYQIGQLTFGWYLSYDGE